MNSLHDAAYRLQLARGYLTKAQRDAADQQWDDCLANAQDAVENAGKAIMSLFRPVPRTHDLLDPLLDLVEQPEVPATVRDQIGRALDAFRDMGLATHIRAAYGDETTRTPPWELIEEGDARLGLDKADRAVALAETIYAEMTKGAPREPP